MFSRLSKRPLAYFRLTQPWVLMTRFSLEKHLVTEAAVSLPQSTKVVICGGGLIGTSTAYHLTQLGYQDVILLTRNKYVVVLRRPQNPLLFFLLLRLGSGTTFYSTGTVSSVRLSPTEIILSRYSTNLYEKLQKEGHSIKFDQVGSIGLASTSDRWLTLKRNHAESK
jgi:pyruvate dehydrogenase phosphatase regulatory subunit